MDFTLTEDQQAFRDTARQFATDRMLPHAAKWDADKIFPAETLREAAALGFGGIYVNDDVGGSALSRFDARVMVDALEALLAGPMATREWSQKALDKGRAAWLAGRVRRLESLSKASLENGLGMLREREVVRGAKLELTPEFRSREKIAALAEEIDQYLR